jgi:hypothetical protein
MWTPPLDLPRSADLQAYLNDRRRMIETVKKLLVLLFLCVLAGIDYLWFWTIPQCLSSGYGTPGYWATQHSVTDNDGPTGCWWQRVTKDRVKQQAFEDWARDSERQEQLDRERLGWRR